MFGSHVFRPDFHGMLVHVSNEHNLPLPFLGMAANLKRNMSNFTHQGVRRLLRSFTRGVSVRECFESK